MLSDPEVPKRCLSLTLLNTPFVTDVVATVADLPSLQCKLPLLTTFLKHLHLHEKALFSISSSSQRTLEMQSLLGIRFELSGHGPATLASEPTSAHLLLSYAPASRLCNLLSAYRLLDVAAFVEGSFSPAAAVPRSAIPTEAAGLHKYSSLKDWPRLLLDCRRSSRRVKGPPALSSHSTSAFSGLFQHLQRTHAAIDRYKCEGNIIVAAAHLAVILGGSFHDNALPDIPDNISLSDSSDSAPIAQDVASFLSGICGNAGKTSGSENLSFLRSPLQLALAVSPLYLIIPVQLTKKSFHRGTVMAISSALGNDRPSLLMDVERCIWRTLFGLASKAIDPSNAVDSMLDLIPWQHIEGLAHTDPSWAWFDIASLPPSIVRPAAASQNLQLGMDLGHQTTGPESVASPQEAQLQTPLPGIDYPDSPLSPISSLPPDLPLHASPSESVEGAFEPNSLAQTLVGSLNIAHTAGPQDATSLDFPADGDVSQPRPTTRAQSKLALAPTSPSAPSPDDAVEPKISKKKRGHRRAKKQASPSEVEEETGEETGDEREGTASNPIDVDLFSSQWDHISKGEYDLLSESVVLDAENVPERKTSDFRFCAFDAEGKSYQFQPAFHHEDYHTRLALFFQAMEGTFEDGLPLHIARPEASVFEVLSYSAFSSMSVTGIHRLLRSKNILVTGCPPTNIAFDEQGLGALHPLHAPISIQDYSYGPSGKKSSAPQTVAGTAKQLLDNARLHKSGKILNGLEFPRWDAAVQSSGYATELVAWHNTRNNHRCPLDSTYPVHHMNWGLAGTSDTVTFVHVDSDGLGTSISVKCGLKVWGIYKSKTDHSLSCVDSFLRPQFSLDNLAKDSPYAFEAVVLRPNDMLVMRPNTPHFVFGPENTICHGSHYYATSTLQDTACSLIHSFVLSDFITNITHHPTRLLLRRTLLFFYLGLFKGKLDPSGERLRSSCPSTSQVLAALDAQHMPDIDDINGIMDLLSLCNLVVLGNILDFRTYSAPNQGETDGISQLQKHLMDTFDRNDIPPSERLSICYARGVASVILDAIRSHCTIVNKDGSTIDDLPTLYLTQQMRSILAYKAAAMRKGLTGAPHCSTAMLRRQLQNLAAWSPVLKELFEDTAIPSAPSLMFSPPLHCKVSWTHRPPFVEDRTYDYLSLGVTNFDRNFFDSEAQKGRFDVQTDGGHRSRSHSRPPLKRMKRDPS